MTTERIKEIQKTTGYPDSVPIQQALLQVWNEVAQESVPLDGLVIRNFAALRDLVNNINESIQESEGLSFTPVVTVKTDGYEFYIEFMDNVMWDSDNNGWMPIIGIELQVREGIRDILRSLSKISV